MAKLESRRCKEKVWTGGYSNPYRQCERMTSNPSGFCTQHDPEYIKRRDAAKKAERDAASSKREQRHKFNLASTDFVKKVAAGKFKDEDDAYRKARAICKQHGIEYDS